MVYILVCNQPSLERAQREEAAQKQEWERCEQMHPEGSFKLSLYPDAEACAWHARDPDSKERRAVCWIGK